jgi:zinc protease
VKTAPWVSIGYKVPAYTDAAKDSAALDIISALAFGPTSPAYQRLVLQEQKVDAIIGSYANHVDPYLFISFSRVKQDKDVDAVRDTIVSTLNGFKDTLVDKTRLDAVRKNLRYRFALNLDNSEAIAQTLAYAVALRRSPETLNKLYAMYDQLTPEDLREVARKYFVENGRTIVTLSGPNAQ